MDHLLSIHKHTEGVNDVEYVQAHLESLLKKVRRHMPKQPSQRLYQLHAALEHIYSHGPHSLVMLESIMDLSKFMDEDQYLERMEDIIDSTMREIEQVDGRIGEAIERALQVQQQMNEKIHKAVENATEQMDKLKRAVADGARRLLRYEELPVQFQYNEFILTGYRFLSSPADCWRSLFYLHNETVNIYTHLLGFVFFFGLAVYELVYHNLASAPLLDRFIFGVFFLAACKCLMCSTVWHTLSGINDYDTFKKLACLDYVGISVLICASIVLTEHYGFYCNPLWRNMYIFGTGVMSVIGIIMPFTSWFEKNEFKWLRISFFIALAASGFLPVIHLCYTHGISRTMAWLSPFFMSMSSYLIGVFLYGNQYPERLFPGMFDHFGHSHQIWHLFVCGGIWYHYMAGLSFVEERFNFACTL